MNATVIIWGLLALFSQTLHYWKYYKNESPSYLKPFEMISGLVSPKSIGIINRKDINELLKKSKLMFGVFRLVIIGASIFGICLSGIPLIINSSLQLFLIEIFWALLYTAYVYFSININFSQMTYFYIICLYLKIKLKNSYNSIIKIFEGKYKMNNYKMMNILKSLNSIILEIDNYNNDFWCKYLIIALMSLIIVFDVLLFQSLFGKISLFLKIILFYGSSILFLMLMILINTASSVSSEVKKSYKLLNKLYIITANNKVRISIKIKV